MTAHNLYKVGMLFWKEWTKTRCIPYVSKATTMPKSLANILLQKIVYVYVLYCVMSVMCCWYQSFNQLINHPMKYQKVNKMLKHFLLERPPYLKHFLVNHFCKCNHYGKLLR